MSFKENILKKITIDKQVKEIILSLKPTDSGVKLNKPAMIYLLEMLPYTLKTERLMDLYIKEGEGEKSEILVLDGELPVYHTTIEDVLIRKAPMLKEMVSIRNAIKILNDKDVVISKKGDTVERIRQECMATLDLNYTENDIETIATDGAEALGNWESDAVLECLDIFSELLSYQDIPRLSKFENMLFRAPQKEVKGLAQFGPVLIYDPTRNTAKFLETSVDVKDKTKVEAVKAVAVGKEKSTLEGKDVFKHLQMLVLKDMKPVRA